jgi:uncharacterized protein (DUF427 family)
MAEHTEPRITLHPHSHSDRILAGDSLIADTRSAIELCERGYSSRQYHSCADVDITRLSVPATLIHFSYKG